MTNQQPKENQGNSTTVHNPKKPSQVEKVDPATGGARSTVQTGRKPAKEQA